MRPEAGDTACERVMVPVKPPREATVIVEVPVAPARMATEFGLAATL